MTELFRRLLLKRLHREKVLSQEVVENMLSWPHSGFHVYASEAFRDPDRIKRTLSYAFRPAVSLKQLVFDSKTQQVTYRSKKNRPSLAKWPLLKSNMAEMKPYFQIQIGAKVEDKCYQFDKFPSLSL